ncbi:MAG: hypothetical protein ACU0DM_12085 [Paracoccus sp. (in: a-proteobacteria)]
MNWPLRELVQRTAYLKEKVDALSLTANVEFTVGVGGDFGTISDALAEMSRRRMAFVNSGSTAAVRLLPGFIMAEQIMVSGIDLSWITISGDDAETLVRRDALTSPLLSQFDGTRYPVFGAVSGAALPRIDQLFTMDTSGDGTNRFGFVLFSGSSMTINSGAGVKSASGGGLFAGDNCSVAANGAILSNCGGVAIDTQGGSIVNIASGDVSGAATIGLRASVGSRIIAQNCNASGCGQRGVLATGAGEISIISGQARSGAANASTDIAVTQGGVVRAHGATGGLSITPNTVTTNGIIYQ